MFEDSWQRLTVRQRRDIDIFCCKLDFARELDYKINVGLQNRVGIVFYVVGKVDKYIPLGVI